MAFGAHGIKLTRKDEGNLKDAFQEAIKTSRSGQSVVINALIGKTDFRKGSISVWNAPPKKNKKNKIFFF